MSIYLDEKNPGKHPPFDDASPDIVEYVRYLEVIAGKSANTAFSYYCDLRGFSRFMKRRRGLVPADMEIKDIDHKGLDGETHRSPHLVLSTANAFGSMTANAYIASVRYASWLGAFRSTPVWSGSP